MRLHDKIIKAVEQSYEGFILANTKGEVFYANAAVGTISGEDISDIVGHTIQSMINNGHLQISTTNKPSNNHLTFVQKTLAGKEVFITSKPVYSEDGQILYYVANYRDLSTLNQLFEQHIQSTSLKVEELAHFRDQQLKTADLISRSVGMDNVKTTIHKIAPTDATVLLLGESGTGKEIIAKTIHNLSERSNYAYITINCGAIPENLIESELFGYEKGAFSGATTSKPGLLEIAHNGTVLLDEIGEMPLHLQVKLLRAIQTNEITRVGGTKKKQLNVRYIAATNKNLTQMVAENTFREDLYYRLNVVQINVLALRERKQDIQLLAQYFLDSYKKKYKKDMYFSEQALQILMDYHCPGNVRQLENIVEQLVILTDEHIITEENLPSDFLKEKRKTNKCASLHSVVEEAEREAIAQALAQCTSIRQAAKLLSVSHPTLLRKMDKYELKK